MSSFVALDLIAAVFLVFFIIPFNRVGVKTRRSLAYIILVSALVMIVYEFYSLLEYKQLSLNIHQIIRIYIWLIGGGTFLFYILYLDARENFAGEFHDGRELTDFAYFTIITATTIGYGDIVPRTTVCRRVVVGFTIACMLINIVVINLIFSHVKTIALSRRLLGEKVQPVQPSRPVSS